MSTPMEHIDHIRSELFSFGKASNRYTKGFLQTMKIASADLYAKDASFVMELIQNAEDNEYAEGINPSLEFIITYRDITCTGALATLLIFNNEKGFSPSNIDSICNSGCSTKEGGRNHGYIGEKGIGFKTVFLISARPYIFSNGYQIRFSEDLCPHCNLGYIVPEWVHQNPVLADINRIYGSSKSLPATILVLPIKPNKVVPVKQQLSCIHPELLLFLTKIKSLSFKEEGEHPYLNTLSEISVSSETDSMEKKNIDAESYSINLVANENGGKSMKQCGYYLWRQRFPVKKENKVESRDEVEEWSIAIAFPLGERLQSGKDSVGVYAYLPTTMITNFPFIIQADFVLTSSRESIQLDNIWNLGIIGCVPSAFVNAFRSMLFAREYFPIFNFPNMFRFIPTRSSPFPPLNDVRDSIKTLLLEESIIFCESPTEQRLFAKPHEVGRLLPEFWNILHEAKNQGVSFDSLSSHGVYILNTCFDRNEHNDVLNFLGINYVDAKWYARCIRSCNLVLGVSDEMYIELLLFISENWISRFHDAGFHKIQLLKYLELDGHVALCSIEDSGKVKKLFMSNSTYHISCLIDWNMEFKRVTSHAFLPEDTQKAIYSYPMRDAVLKWLTDKAHVSKITVYDYANLLIDSVGISKDCSIIYAHFLHHLLVQGFMSEFQINILCGKMPLVDNYGCVVTSAKGVLVPGRESKWLQLIGTNQWRSEGYIELGEDYLRPTHLSAMSTKEKDLVSFLKNYVEACDIPDLTPPDAEVPTMSSPLTKQNAFLLLEWIRTIRYKRTAFPSRFLSSIKKGRWLRILLTGASGFKSPSESFLPSTSWGSSLQDESLVVDIPLVDETFYGGKIHEYKEELRMVGVRFEYGEACKYMGEQLMGLAATSSLSKSNVFSIMKCIRILRQKMLPVDDFVTSIKERKWLRTSCGDMAPVHSVLFGEEWKVTLEICDIPFIQEDYYGDRILSFTTELSLLGVIIGFGRRFEIIPKYLKSSTDVHYLGPVAFLLVLECIQHSGSTDKFVSFVKNKQFVKTSMGYNSAGDCLMLSPEWDFLLQVFDCFPLIDVNYYGSKIWSLKGALKRIGVLVDVDEAMKKFSKVFQQMASSTSIKKEHAISLLTTYRLLNERDELPIDLRKCLCEVKWLRTKLGDYRCAKECILFGEEWEAIAQISLIPFLDDKHYGTELYEFRKELKSLGVVLQFQDGPKHVVSCLYFPEDPSCISCVSVLALLDSVRTLKKIGTEELPNATVEKLSVKWVRTHHGYMKPSQSLLFSNEWSCFLHPKDGSFIDEGFYDSKLSSYKEELKSVGVVVDVNSGSQIMSSFLSIHSEFSAMVRIYCYLKRTDWKPIREEDKKIWIPDGKNGGERVSPETCSLYDRDRLFNSQLNILEKHYDQDLLGFFSSAFEIKSYPLVGDYCKLWKSWESSSCNLPLADCGSFWGYVSRSLNVKALMIFCDEISKVPVWSGSCELNLVEKGDAFIADDLQLRDLFEQASSVPLFVWYPLSDLHYISRAKLADIYQKIGVKTLSGSVIVENTAAVGRLEFEHASRRLHFLNRSFFTLVLGFLAGTSVGMEAEERHKVMRCLLNLSVFETEEPISRIYRLSLSSGKMITVNARQILFWDRKKSELFMQKIDISVQKNILEFATQFSKIVSEGLLWDREKDIVGLRELLKLGFLVRFDTDAVDYLMKSNNLQIFEEDENFLLEAFSSI